MKNNNLQLRANILAIRILRSTKSEQKVLNVVAKQCKGANAYAALEYAISINN